MAPPRSEEIFTPADLEKLRSAGIPTAEALRQIELLAAPPRYTVIERSCAPGDGISVLAEGDRPRLEDLHRRAAAAGRCARFVPASGAATRMFKPLLRYQGEGGRLDGIRADAAGGIREAVEAERFLSNLGKLPFGEELASLLGERGRDPASCLRDGDVSPILDAVLLPSGLGLAGRPKALLGFHRYPEGPRTPLEEHLVEAAGLVRDGSGTCRVHFTVSASEEEEFRSLLQRAGPALEKRLDVRFEVSFSRQKPSTDTLALDEEGRPFRTAAGELLLRPSGHGALLENLDDLRGDIVLVKNIDNVVPDGRKEPTFLWSRLLSGLAAELRERTTAALARLRSSPEDRGAVEEALAFAASAFGRAPARPVGPDGARRDAAIDLLDRPVRVCGMVRNTGEPGGGPFWVRDADGRTSVQIVETSQIDPGAAPQQAILAGATHSNPVFIACSLRDGEGRPYALGRYVDPRAVIVARKSFEGRNLVSLERPGLWNGAMAGWNTVFVEVPLEVFNPVKTVNDLLREAHQPA